MIIQNAENNILTNSSQINHFSINACASAFSILSDGLYSGQSPIS